MVRVDGGSDKRFKLVEAICQAINTHSVRRHARPIKVSVEDSPAQLDRKGQVVRAARALELKLPRGVTSKIDWPDRIYASAGGQLGRLLARFPFGARSISWLEPNIREYCPGITSAELDEVMEQI